MVVSSIYKSPTSFLALFLNVGWVELRLLVMSLMLSVLFRQKAQIKELNDQN